MSRNTVRKALRCKSFKEYVGDKKNDLSKSRSNVSKFNEKILKMLVKYKFISSKILLELSKAGYRGSKTAFYDYLAKLKVEVNLSKIIQRYETDLGVLTQFDWLRLFSNARRHSN